MRASSHLRRLGAVTGLAFLAGCQVTTISSRVAEKQALFGHCTPRQQELMRRGMIANGFSPDMVYIVLAKPDQVISGPGPQQERWIYHSYYAADGSSQIPTKIVTHEGAGAAPGGGAMGYMPGAVHGTGRLSYTVEYDPGAIRTSIVSTRRVEVIFNFGRVAAIQIVED